MQCSICKRKDAWKPREVQSCTLVNMDQSQNADQLVKASEVDNVRHAERDYFVKAWIACQYTGLYPHGARLRQKHRDIIFRLSLHFTLSWERGALAQISGSRGAFLTASILDNIEAVYYPCWIMVIFCSRMWLPDVLCTTVHSFPS